MATKQGSKKKDKKSFSKNKSHRDSKGNSSYNDIFTKKQDPPFEEYWSKEKVSEGLKRGTLMEGIVRINQNDYNEAYISDPRAGPDYFLSGVWSRNRSLEGDTVAFEVLPPDKWEQYKKQTHSDTATAAACNGDLSSDLSTPGDLSSEVVSTTDMTTPTNKQATPSTEPLQRTLIDALYDSQTVVGGASVSVAPSLVEQGRDLRKYRRVVKVVYIINKGHSRAVSGSVKIYNKRGDLFRQSMISVTLTTIDCLRQGLGLALFSPRDTRVQRIVIKLSDLPSDFCQNFSKYEKSLFICRIGEWNETQPFPNGQVMRSLGEAGEIQPETDSILAEYEIDDREFPQEVSDCLTSLFTSSDASTTIVEGGEGGEGGGKGGEGGGEGGEGRGGEEEIKEGGEGRQWTISQEEIGKRRDFRNDCVVTIDPSTARDLDDAVHCKLISPGVYEVGVHIADVSYFLSAGSVLDRIASQRATSVYLIQKVIPMLPRILCEEFCSLNPHQERLTVSVVWKLTLKGELLDEWMGRSIISSRAKLSYEDAQRMIDDPQYPWQHSDFPCISDPQSVPMVVNSVVTLNKITKQLRFLRQKRGSLRLDQPKLVFSLDQSTGLPNSCHIYQHGESNKLIEECMLLANMAVAHKISETYPNLSLLRRHPPPKDKAIDTLREQFNIIGVTFGFSTSGELQDSLNRYVSKRTTDEGVVAMEKQVIISMCCKAMELAQYICTSCFQEKHYHHYALNVPRYTHFTSPIRRYADVIVHRLLIAAIEGVTPAFIEEDIEDQANVCNKKRKNAKLVEEFSSNLFLGVFIRECGPVVHEGMVAAVLDKSFDVLIIELGIIKRVYCEKLSLSEYKYELRGDNKSDPHLLLLWKQENNKVPIPQDIGVFSCVKVILTSIQKTLKFEARIEPPTEAVVTCPP